MKFQSTVPIHIAKQGYILLSVIFCLIGVFFFVHPDNTSEAVANVGGISLILFGIFKLLGYFSHDLYRLAFQYDLEIGVLLIILGAVTLIKRGSGLDLICVSLGVAFFTDSLFKLHITYDAKRFGIRAWWSILVLSILTLISAVTLILRPETFVNLNYMSIFFGICVLLEGLLNLVVVIFTVKIINYQHPDETKHHFSLKRNQE